jgi:pimeloyl-ACP methyl ester carboxylesterase
MKRTLKYGCGTTAALLFIAFSVLAYLVFVRVEGEYFQSNGARIHYTDEGNGVPVILVHGFAANADLNWRRAGVVGALNDDFRVITFDLRGHGLSDRLYEEDAYGLKMVEDVIALMDHLKIEKAHVAGYSLGGFITLKLAAEHPDRLLSAAICAAGWRDPKDQTDLLNPYRPPQTQVTRVLNGWQSQAGGGGGGGGGACGCGSTPITGIRTGASHKRVAEETEVAELVAVNHAGQPQVLVLGQAPLLDLQPQASPPPPPAPSACDWHPRAASFRTPHSALRISRPASAVITPLEWKGFTHWVRNFVGDRIVDKKAMKTSKKTWPSLVVDEAQLAQIQVPMICFIGTRDGLFPYAQQLHAVRPDIDYVVLEGKGHMSTAISWEFQEKLRNFFLENSAV